MSSQGSIKGFDHHIQREIFTTLRGYDVARYADIHIKTIESSQFMYHLKELISRGLVEKVEKGRYRLSAKGIALSQNFSSEQKDLRLSPLTYTFILARSNKGNWLIWNRGQQPFINMYGTLSGKVHMDETLTEAAQREWCEQVNTRVPNLVYKGQISVLLKQDGVTATHIAGAIWFVDNCKQEWETLETKKGTLSWIDWTTLPYDKFIPGWKEIVEAIESSEYPFLLDLELPL